MREFISVIRRAKLFNGLIDEEIYAAIDCLNAKVRQFGKGERVFCEGEDARFVGVVLSGEVQTQKTDYDGNTNIISKVFSPGLVAGAAAFSFEKTLPFDVVAVCESEVLMISSSALSQPCNKVCSFHMRIIRNMLSVLAEKNVEFTQKIVILTKRTIREKIMTYLYSQSKLKNSNSFTIGLSRRQMAEYLSTNRSALSRELSNMQDEGIIEYSENYFQLK